MGADPRPQDNGIPTSPVLLKGADMKEDMDLVKRTVEKLRADLMATNSVLMAIVTSMPAEQQRQALNAVAQMSAMKAQLVEKSQNPAERAMLQLVQASEERLYQAMQGAHKMRMQKLGPDTG